MIRNKTSSRNNFFLPIYTLWGRYFIKETLKIFFLFIICFYGLYFLIDFSSHSTSFHHHHLSFKLGTLLFYYGCEFIKRAEVIVPFALMVATIKVLCNLNIHNELVAMLASGVKIKSLLRPFVFLGIIFTLIMYGNTEYFLPLGLKQIKMMDTNASREKNKANEKPAVQHVLLEDESTLLFHDYDTIKERFIDAYWVQSVDDIHHMKYLYPYKEIPIGEHVDHLSRDANGNLTVQTSTSQELFPKMRFNDQKLLDTLIQPQELSIKELKTLHQKRGSWYEASNEKEAQLLSVFYYKLALPWLCLLAVIAPAPFCIQSTRQLPVFFIYALGIFGLVAFYLIMDAALVLGSRQIFTPILAILTPFSLIFGFFLFRYIKLQ